MEVVKITKVKKISKYSYNIIIPKKVVEKLGLDKEPFVAIGIEDGKIIVQKVDMKKLLT